MVGGWDKSPGPENDYSRAPGQPKSSWWTLVIMAGIAIAASWYLRWPQSIWGEPTLEAQTHLIERFFRDNRYGSSADVYLVKLNAFGQEERVAVIYGFLDDAKFCFDVAELYMRENPQDKYSCSLAN